MSVSVDVHMCVCMHRFNLHAGLNVCAHSSGYQASIGLASAAGITSLHIWAENKTIRFFVPVAIFLLLVTNEACMREASMSQLHAAVNSYLHPIEIKENLSSSSSAAVRVCVAICWRGNSRFSPCLLLSYSLVPLLSMP